MAVTDHERTIINERLAEKLYDQHRADVQAILTPTDFAQSSLIFNWEDMDAMARRPYREAALEISTPLLEITEQVIGHRIWAEGHQVGGDQFAAEQGFYVPGYETIGFDSPYPEVVA